MSALTKLQEAAKIANSVLTAAEVIQPLIDYIAGVTDDRPPVLAVLPPELSNKVELEALRIRSNLPPDAG